MDNTSKEKIVLNISSCSKGCGKPQLINGSIIRVYIARCIECKGTGITTKIDKKSL